jgi:hypothetical protein
MTKWTQRSAIFGFAAILAALIASLLQAQSAATSPDSDNRGNEVLFEAAKAAGGEKLNSIATLGINESGRLITSQGDTTLVVKWLVSYPDRSHGEVTFGDQKIIQVCDGTSAWLQIAQGTRDTTPVISEFKRGISLFGGGWGIYELVLAGKLAGQFIGETEIDGKKTLGVAVEGSFGPLKLYFDPITHLLAADINPPDRKVPRTTNSAGATTERSKASYLRSPPSPIAMAQSFSSRRFKMCS